MANFIGDNFTGFAVFVSAILASLGWYFGNRHAQLVSRRQHTFDVYNSYRDNEEFDSKRRHVRGIFESGNLPDPSDTHRSHDLEPLNWLLDHYEFICAAIMSGDIDERLMKKWEKTRILKLFSKGYPYIVQEREHIAQPTMCSELEMVYRRWTNDLPFIGFRVPFEFVALRPYAPKAWAIRGANGLRGADV